MPAPRRFKSVSAAARSFGGFNLSVWVPHRNEAAENRRVNYGLPDDNIAPGAQGQIPTVRGHTPRTGTGSKPLPPSTRRRSSASLAFWKKYGRSTERSSSSRRFRLPPTLPSFHKHHQGRPLPLLFRAATCADRPFDRLIRLCTLSSRTLRAHESIPQTVIREVPAGRCGSCAERLFSRAKA